MIGKGLLSGKPEMKANITGLDDKYFFYYGIGMQKQWVDTNKALMNFIASKCGQSVKASIEEGTLVVIEMDDSIMPRFDAEEEEKAYVTGLKHWEKKLHNAAWEDYLKFRRVIRQGLSTVHGVICSLCHVSIRNCLEGEVEFQDMIKNKKHSAITLHKLIEKTCNGSTSVVREDVIGNLVESLHNYALVRGDDYESLSKHVEVSEQRYEMAKSSGLELANSKVRDRYLEELLSRNQSHSTLCTKLKSWKDAPADSKGDDDRKKGIDALNEVIRSRIYMKRSGKEFDQFRREIANGCVAGNREHPSTIVEANRQMEYFRPLAYKKGNPNGRPNGGDGGTGDQLFGESRRYPCFKCDRFKPECKGAKECTFTSKVDGSPINSDEVVKTKFEELKAAKRRARQSGSGQEGGGTQLATEGEIIPNDETLPSWDANEVIDEEERWEWAFKQSHLGMKIDKEKKEILCDLSDKDNHIYNQIGER